MPIYSNPTDIMPCDESVFIPLQSSVGQGPQGEPAINVVLSKDTDFFLSSPFTQTCQFEFAAFKGAERVACIATTNSHSGITARVARQATSIETGMIEYKVPPNIYSAKANFKITFNVDGTIIEKIISLIKTPEGPQGETGPQGPQGETGDAGDDGYSFVSVNGSFVPVHTNPDDTTRVGMYDLIFEAYRGSEKLDVTSVTFVGPPWITTSYNNHGMLRINWPDDETLVDSVNCGITATVDDHGTTRTEQFSIVVGAVKDGAKGPQGRDGGQKITKTLSGTLLTASDAYAAPPVDMTAYGMSTQVTTTGKNLLPNVLPANTINATFGNTTLNSASKARVFAIPCEQNTNYVFSSNTNGTVANLGLSDKLPAVGDTITKLTAMNYTQVYSFNSGEHTYILVNVTNVDSFNAIPSKEGMIEVGSTATAYEPYTGGAASPRTDWVQPIESVDALTLHAHGTNLLDMNAFSDYSNWNTSRTYAGFTVAVPNGTVVVHYDGDIYRESGVYLNVNAGSAAAASGNFLAHPNSGMGSTSRQIEVTTGAITFGLYSKNAATLEKVVSNIGSTLRVTLDASEPYEPYVGTSTTIDLQGHELRSLPNGTKDELNLTYIGNGLTEGYGLYHAELTQYVESVDMGEVTPVRSGNFFRVFPAGMRKATTAGQALLMCECLEVGVSTTRGAFESYAPDNRICPIYGQSYSAEIRADSYATADELKAALAGRALVYPLATPVTHDLGTVTLPTNPAPDMTVWADGGNATPSLSLTYERDIGIALADMQAEVEHVWAQLAPVEQSTATANHAVGTYLVLGGTFCKVTMAIAIGETVAIGTNVAATTVAAELLAIQA